MNTKAIAAAVTGARHLRVGRNGQDAAASWVGAGCGAIVVCDGCSAGGSSEVGARLGAQLVIRALADALEAPAAGFASDWPALWAGVRAIVVAELDRLADAMPGSRAAIVEEHFLFTTIAVAWRGEDVAVWALGDGAYALGDQVTVLGPFESNQPPYLGYDLLGLPQVAHTALASAACGTAAVATDGVAELDGDLGLAALAAQADRWLAHPDALRRRLAVLARGAERIDWDARRIHRVPAPLQDDGAVAILRWAVPS